MATRGVWRVLTPESDIICVSHQTPLHAFARWVRVDALHEAVPAPVRGTFTGTLICDEQTWILLNDVTIEELGRHAIEGMPVWDLGRLLLIEHSSITGGRDVKGGPDRFRRHSPNLPRITDLPGRTITPPAGERPTPPDNEEIAGPNYHPNPSPTTSALSLQFASLESHRFTSPLIRPRDKLQSPGLKVFPSSSPPCPEVFSFGSDTPKKPLEDMPLPLEGNQKLTAVAKAQEHCRVAMNALDFEDAEKAKAEIRAAIALLGGEF